jgi:hypothetical protein
MRTTLTLDDDVAALLRRVRKASRDASLKEVVNEALRHGLRLMTQGPAKPEPARTRTVDLGRCLVGTLDDVSAAIAVAEGDAFR